MPSATSPMCSPSAGPVEQLTRPRRGRGRDPRHRRRGARRGRALSAESLYPARHAADGGRRGAAAPSPTRRRRPATTTALARMHLPDGAPCTSDFDFDLGATARATRPPRRFARRRGVCQDFAHIFIAAARHLGVPARYVSGYLCRGDRRRRSEAGRRPRLGGGLYRGPRLGRLRSRPTTSARPKPMSASRSGSTISARRRCAARAMAAARRWTLTVDVAVERAAAADAVDQVASVKPCARRSRLESVDSRRCVEPRQAVNGLR